MFDFRGDELEQIAVVRSYGAEIIIYKQWHRAERACDSMSFVGFVLGRYPLAGEIKQVDDAVQPILLPISREVVDRLTGLLQSELTGQERDERQKFELLRIADHHSRKS